MADDLDSTTFEAPVELSADTPGIGPGTSIGRYLILAELGAGAMGVVLMAYDPELDRRVAIKLLKPALSRAGILLKREAQALAKLAHPNVVAVYDVGNHRERVFVTMEYVEGQVLSAWLGASPGPSWREVLSVYLAAAKGLAAAHGQGLVHRDFKPDNVMLGADGRVRVMDFGLARAERGGGELEQAQTREEVLAGAGTSSLTSLRLTRTGALTGTPAYMAPEQYGGHADALSDQFSFCVALYEGLYNRHPFYSGQGLAELHRAIQAQRFTAVEAPPKDCPSWLREVVVRGLAPAAADRHPSMDALIAALTHDPRARRRRWLAGLGGAATLVGLSWAAWPRPEPEPETCVALERELEPVWSDASAAQLHEAFAQTALSYAEAEAAQVQLRLDGYASRWLAQRRDACEQHEQGRQSDALFDLRVRCLDAHLRELGATVEVLTAADEGVVDRAAEVVEELPSLARCGDPDILTAAFPVPDDPELRARIEAVEAELARARAHKRAGQYGVAAAELAALEPEVEALAHPPALVELLATEAGVLLGQDRYPDALPSLERAYALALEHQMTREAASQAIQIMGVLGNQFGRVEHAQAWRIHAEALTRAVADPHIEVSLIATLARLDDAAGDYESAVAGYLEALRRLDELDAAEHGDDPGADADTSIVGQRKMVFNHLSLSYQHLNRWTDALAAYERQLEFAIAAHGPRHPRVASALYNCGITEMRLGRPEAAKSYYERALDIRVEVYGPDDHNVARLLMSLGLIAAEAGDYAEAELRYRRALEITETQLGPDDAKLGPILHNLAEAQRRVGQLDAAEASYRRAIELLESGGDAGYPLTGLGQVELARGRPERAVEPLEAARAAFEASPTNNVQLGETSFALAQALAASPAKQARAREVGLEALGAYREAQQPVEAELAAVEAWLRAHGVEPG